MKLRHLLLALGVCLVLLATAATLRDISPAYPGIAATSEGAFPENGQFKGEALAHARGVRFWGSWAGDDANHGSLALGPFPAPARLRFAVGGYPTHAGNSLFLELDGTGTREPITIARDAGERWRIEDIRVPAGWIGKPVRLVARDDAGGGGGWLALSEPLRGGPGSGNAELLETLAAWAVNGLLLALPWFAFLRLVTARGWVAPHWAPLVAAGGVAACGQAAFWLFFAHATAGKLFSVSVLTLGALGATRRGTPDDQPSADALIAARLLVAIGLLYLALLHLMPSSREFYDLAANRFREGLPGDNTLPHYLGDFLHNGAPLRQPGADWLSSDRPPLQTGWLMLTRSVDSVLGLEPRAAGGTTAVWLQSLWVFGIHGLLRSLGLARARAAAWLGLLAITGFFAQNTVFTWPKLSAAAFACGAFALWMWPRGARPTPAEYGLGAMLAGLAWLSHGGVAFSLLTLAPWLAWRALRGEWRGFVIAGAVFALFAGPWFLYQKFYDPPGDRLLKWHLGGVIPKDTRGAWQTIRESHEALKPGEFWANKTFNLLRQVEGDWRWWHQFSTADARQRRNDEFFMTARALTWWLVGLAALPVVLLARRPRARLAGFGRAHAELAVWTFTTLVLWCLLMFTGGQAVIHQGSYAVMLGLFALLSVWSELLSPWLICVIAPLQVASFTVT